MDFRIVMGETQRLNIGAASYQTDRICPHFMFRQGQAGRAQIRDFANRRLSGGERRVQFLFARHGAQGRERYGFEEFDVGRFLARHLGSGHVPNRALGQVDIKAALIIFGDDGPFGFIALIQER